MITLPPTAIACATGQCDLNNTDIACWGPTTEDFISYWTQKGPLPCQNKDVDFSRLERTYKTQRRCLSKSLFVRKFKMGNFIMRFFLFK